MKEEELEAKIRNKFSEEEFEYWKALMRVKQILPADPPQYWEEEHFELAKELSKIIEGRLKKFLDLEAQFVKSKKERW